MRKELFGITRENAADNNSYILEYYLLEDEVLTDGVNRMAYGIEVKKIIPLKGKTIEETSSVCDIFAQRCKTENFIRLLTDCKVTPVHLKDIVLDFVGGENENNVLYSA